MVQLSYMPEYLPNQGYTFATTTGIFNDWDDAEEYAYHFLRDVKMLYFWEKNYHFGITRKGFEKRYEERHSSATLEIPRNIRILHWQAS